MIPGRYQQCMVVVVLATLMSCAAPPDDRATAEIITAFHELMYRPVQLDHAEDHLVGECMTELGLHYPTNHPEIRASEPATGLLRTPAPLSLDDARASGYPATLMRDPERPPVAPVDAVAQSLPPDARKRYYQALLGDDPHDVRVTLPDGFEVGTSSMGCVGVARRQIYGSVQNYLTIVYLPELAQHHVSVVVDDLVMRDVLQTYAGCMTGHGYQVGTPQDAVELALSYYPAGRRNVAKNAEIALATVDAQCQQGARLQEKYKLTEDRVATLWIVRNQSVIASAHEALKETLARLRDLGYDV